jgi:5-formyltetrahydrofolate cyclo-ligase
MTDKSEIREIYKAKRRSLSSERLEEISLSIANQILRLDIWDCDNFHLFLPIQKQYEIDTQFILHILKGRDKNVIISKSNFEKHTMTHYLLTDNTRIQENEYGIPEPVDNLFEFNVDDIDVVFVPLLAVDQQGNRVGYGKGFYDKFLKSCRSTTIKIGLSHFDLLEEEITPSQIDVPVNYIVTPDGVVRI